jgi:hypothetical protein
MDFFVANTKYFLLPRVIGCSINEQPCLSQLVNGISLYFMCSAMPRGERYHSKSISRYECPPYGAYASPDGHYVEQLGVSEEQVEALYGGPLITSDMESENEERFSLGKYSVNKRL